MKDKSITNKIRVTDRLIVLPQLKTLSTKNNDRFKATNVRSSLKVPITSQQK